MTRAGYLSDDFVAKKLKITVQTCLFCYGNSSPE